MHAVDSLFVITALFMQLLDLKFRPSSDPCIPSSLADVTLPAKTTTLQPTNQPTQVKNLMMSATRPQQFLNMVYLTLSQVLTPSLRILA
jgi:hypothetical protein